MKHIMMALVALVLIVSCKEEPRKPQPLDLTESVAVETDLGTIVVGLYGNAMPISVSNFLKYVDSGFYDGTVFHRVIAGFVAQGGGYTKDGSLKKTRDPIALEMSPAKPKEKDDKSATVEALLTNGKNTIAMARQRVPNSATSQFYFNLKNNIHLDGDITKPEPSGYAVFGLITAGSEVLTKIVTSTGKGKKVLITSIKRVAKTKKGEK